MSGDHAQLMQRMRAMWAEGDWPAIAARLDDAAASLATQCGVAPGDKVLDVAAGNGNAAVWAARAGAQVVATDLSPLLVEQGQRRCEADGLAVDWTEADMEDLPFADATFDAVLCAFGISFAPRLEVALGEMFRVARPGGHIALVNWTRDGWPARMSAVMERHLRPPSATAPSRLADKGAAVGLWLLENAAEVRMERGVVWQHFASPQAWFEHWHASAPQMAVARGALSDEQYDKLRDDLIASVSAADTGEGSGCRWACPYLIVVATRRPMGDDYVEPRRQGVEASA